MNIYRSSKPIPPSFDSSDYSGLGVKDEGARDRRATLLAKKKTAAPAKSAPKKLATPAAATPAKK